MALTNKIGTALWAGLMLSFATAAPAQESSELQELREQVHALTERVNTLSLGESGAMNGAKIGGYAEVHYNAPEEGTTQVDFHRFVLLISKPINEWIFFNSEVEFEHAFLEGGEESGELKLEQAWLQFQMMPTLGIRAGIVLVPVGLVNPRHEPTTFYGVERPDFHRVIVPATWFDYGAGVVGQAGDLSYEAYLMSPLDASGLGGSSAIRSGRQEALESETESLAITGMARYRLPGVAAGLSFWRGNSLSSAVRECAANPATGEEEEETDCANTAEVDIDSVVVSLYALDLEAMFGIFQIRAEYALGTIENSDKLNQITDRGVPSEFNGYYVEPSARVWQSGDHALGVFARYEALNPQAEVKGGEVDDSLNYVLTTAGINYWPHPDVVVKGDFGQREPKEGATTQGFNLGLGWVF